VLAVRLNRKRLVVLLEDEIYLYDIANVSLLYTIATSPNPLAICSLSPSSDNCYLAYPLPKPREARDDKQRPSHAPPLSAYVAPTSGEVLIFDTVSLKAVNVIEAHRSPLCCIALNNDGTLLATASETGTIIRVFSVPRGQKLFQFRRGTYPSTIYSMSFNLSSTLVCVSSTSDTVHIFRLVGPGGSGGAGAVAAEASTAGIEAPITHQEHRARSRSYDSGNDSPSSATGSPRSEMVELAGPSSTSSPPTHRRQSGSFGNILRRSSQIMGRSVAGVVGSYLPQTVTEMWEPLRDFAYIKIPKTGSSAAVRAGQPVSAPGAPAGPGSAYAGGPLRSVVAMSSNSPQVMVVTSDGGFYVFSIDMEHGGEGFLVKQFSCVPPSLPHPSHGQDEGRLRLGLLVCFSAASAVPPCGLDLGVSPADAGRAGFSMETTSSTRLRTGLSSKPKRNPRPRSKQSIQTRCGRDSDRRWAAWHPQPSQRKRPHGRPRDVLRYKTRRGSCLLPPPSIWILARRRLGLFPTLPPEKSLQQSASPWSMGRHCSFLRHWR